LDAALEVLFSHGKNEENTKLHNTKQKNELFPFFLTATFRDCSTSFSTSMINNNGIRNLSGETLENLLRMKRIED
jgi:hypothetical protein